MICNIPRTKLRLSSGHRRSIGSSLSSHHRQIKDPSSPSILSVPVEPVHARTKPWLRSVIEDILVLVEDATSHEGGSAWTKRLKCESIEYRASLGAARSGRCESMRLLSRIGLTLIRLRDGCPIDQQPQSATSLEGVIFASPFISGPRNKPVS